MSFVSTKDYFVCYKCGVEFDRNSEWQMSLIDNHMERHRQVGAE